MLYDIIQVTFHSVATSLFAKSFNVTTIYISFAGNICRSPTAEAIFRDEVKKRGLTEQVDFMSLTIYKAMIQSGAIHLSVSLPETACPSCSGP